MSLLSLSRRCKVLGAVAGYPNLLRRQRTAALRDVLGGGAVPVVAHPSQFQHHRGGEAVLGGRERGPRLQRPPEPRSRRAGGPVDLRRQDTRPAKLHGRAAREAEPPRARYHRDLRRPV